MKIKFGGIALFLALTMASLVWGQSAGTPESLSVRSKSIFQVVPTPNPDPNNDGLEAVASSSATDIWAVGSGEESEHWTWAIPIEPAVRSDRGFGERRLGVWVGLREGRFGSTKDFAAPLERSAVVEGAEPQSASAHQPLPRRSSVRRRGYWAGRGMDRGQ